MPLGSAAIPGFPRLRRAAILLAAPCSPAPSLAECSSCLSNNSPQRRCCCAWCHPVVLTAAHTHHVKPSSGLSLSPSLSPPLLLPALSLSLPARHPWLSDVLQARNGVNSPRVSPILTVNVATFHCSVWRRGSKAASLLWRCAPPLQPAHRGSDAGECAQDPTIL